MIRRFLYLNGIATLCVVLFHATGMGFVSMIDWAQRYGSYPGEQIGTAAYYGLRFVEQFVVFAIPAFLIVSGYFIGFATGKSQKTVSWKIVFSRIGYLVVPYLVWSAVILTLRYLEGRTYSPGHLLLMILIGNTNEVMYYVPLLVQLYLISPILIRWAKTNWQQMLLITGIIQLIVTAIGYPTFLGIQTPTTQFIETLIPKWIFLARIFWFSLGIVLGYHPTEFKQTFYPMRWWLLGTALVLIPLGVIEWEQYFRLSGLEWLSSRETLLDLLYCIGLVLGVLAFEKARFPLFDKVSWLGTKSFGIYLTHGIVIEYIARAIYRFQPNLLTNQFVLQPVLVLFGLGVPLLMITVVDKSPFRRYYTYLFG